MERLQEVNFSRRFVGELYIEEAKHLRRIDRPAKASHCWRGRSAFCWLDLSDHHHIALGSIGVADEPPRSRKIFQVRRRNADHAANGSIGRELFAGQLTDRPSWSDEQLIGNQQCEVVFPYKVFCAENGISDTPRFCLVSKNDPASILQLVYSRIQFAD